MSRPAIFIIVTHSHYGEWLLCQSAPHAVLLLKFSSQSSPACGRHLPFMAMFADQQHSQSRAGCHCGQIHALQALLRSQQPSGPLAVGWTLRIVSIVTVAIHGSHCTETSTGRHLHPVTSLLRKALLFLKKSPTSQLNWLTQKQNDTSRKTNACWCCCLKMVFNCV
jgi:hypothetical protein